MTRQNWINILLLGAGFMMLFSAFQTTAFVQGITISSFLSPKCHENVTVVVDGGIHITEGFADRIGYISLCIIYLMVAVCNWLSVPLVAVFGAKWSMVVSAALYVIYIAAIIRPYVPMVFLGAFILGSAGGVLWTAQGQILIQNSSKERMPTTSGIFWFMLQMSLVVGNLFFALYLKYRDTRPDHCISHKDNYIIFGVMTTLGVLGVLLLLLVMPQPKKDSSLDTSNVNAVDSKPLLAGGTEERSGRRFAEAYKALGAIVIALKMLVTPDMMLLAVTFIYTGYELNFWSGVYGPIIGHTRVFAYYNIGLAGFFIGIGEILGGALFGIFGKYTNRFGRDPVVLLGMLLHFVAFLLCYYNLPNDAINNDVSIASSFGTLFNPSNIYLAMACAFLLGLGDSCFNTQIYSIIGVLYPKDENSAPAMALYKFFQSIAAMVGFLTSTFIRLQWQLLILVVLATAGTITFALVEWGVFRKPLPKF